MPAISEKSAQMKRTIRRDSIRVSVCRPGMAKWVAASSVAAVLAFTVGSPLTVSRASAQQELAVSAQALSARKQKGAGFPDFGFMVTPAEYAAKYADQPVFRLKADFPHEKPTD